MCRQDPVNTLWAGQGRAELARESANIAQLSWQGDTIDRPKGTAYSDALGHTNRGRHLPACEPQASVKAPAQISLGAKCLTGVRRTAIRCHRRMASRVGRIVYIQPNSATSDCSSSPLVKYLATNCSDRKQTLTRFVTIRLLLKQTRWCSFVLAASLFELLDSILTPR